MHRSVRRLIQAVTDPQHPLVLAFDDLQWADNASLEMISQLLRHPDLRRLLVVGSCRSNEVGPDHPLTAIIAELREHGVAETVTLRPLPKTAIAAILADTIHASRKRTLQLAQVVTGKTGGNPLFATQFVHRLNELGLLTFDQAGLGWVWDLDRVRQVPAADNVVELVTARMSRLGPKLPRLLEAAAVLGVTFDLGTISEAIGREPNAVADDLVPVLRQGLIGAVSGGLHVARSVTAQYRWSHDRVRQAALGLIAPEVMPRMHLALGRALQSERTAAELEDQLFEVVRHLNAAGGLMSSIEERTELATLNFAAGRRAKLSGAPTEARSYFVAAMEALPADAWTEVYDLAFSIHCELADAEHVAGEHDRAFELLDAAFGRARTVFDRVELLRLRVVCLNDLGDVSSMFRYGLEGLDLLGIEIPEDPRARRRAARAAVAGLGGRLSKLSPEDILRTPPASDSTTVSAGNFIAFVLPPATTDPDLFALLTSRGVELALDHGFTGPLAYALALHGIVMHQRLADDEGCRWCMDVARRLIETLKAYDASQGEQRGSSRDGVLVSAARIRPDAAVGWIPRRNRGDRPAVGDLRLVLSLLARVRAWSPPRRGCWRAGHCVGAPGPVQQRRGGIDVARAG